MPARLFYFFCPIRVRIYFLHRLAAFARKVMTVALCAVAARTSKILIGDRLLLRSAARALDLAGEAMIADGL